MVLVLFVILGAYLLIQICADNASYNKAQKQISDSRDRKERWCSTIIDRNLETELRLFINRPENRDAVLKQVSDVYDKILEGKRIDELYPRWMWCKKKKNWSDKYHEEMQELVCRLDSNNALRIMMAKRGKFPSLDAITGSAKQFNPDTKLEAQVLIWCADELKHHGVKEEFYVPNVLAGFGEGGDYMGWII